MPPTDQRERLVRHVQQLERLDAARQEAAQEMRDAFAEAERQGFDRSTLKVVLRLRKMSPEERKQERALVAIYLAALGMLEGDPLTDEARRRLDGQDQERPREARAPRSTPAPASSAPPAPETPAAVQPPLFPPKDPEEARTEGRDASAAGKRIYDNPYPAGDPCRAAWDEGWCTQRKSHGMDTPAAFQRRTPPKPPDPSGDQGKDAGEGDERGAA